MKDLGAKYLSEVIKINETIIDLNISGNQIKDIGASNLFNSLEKNSSIENFNLCGKKKNFFVHYFLSKLDNYIFNESSESLFNMLKKNKTLKTFGLTSNFTSEIWKEFKFNIKENHTISSLNLSYNVEGEYFENKKQIEQMFEIIKECKSLHSINLSSKRRKFFLTYFERK